MLKGPALVAEFDNNTKVRLKKSLTNESYLVSDPIFNQCVTHPVVLRQGPSGMFLTNITGSGNPVWSPNAYCASQLAKFGIPPYQINRQKASYFGFQDFGSTISPRGLHVYNSVNTNLVHHYLPLAGGERLTFKTNFTCGLQEADILGFVKQLDIELAGHLANGTAVVFTEVSRSGNLRFSHDISEYCKDLLIADGQRAIEQFGLSNSAHKLSVSAIDNSDYLLLEKQKLLQQFVSSTSSDNSLLAKELTYKLLWVRTFASGNHPVSFYQTLLLYKGLHGGKLNSLNMVSIANEKAIFERFLLKSLPNHPIKPFVTMDNELEVLCDLLLQSFNQAMIP